MDPFPYLEPLAVWLWKTSWQASVLVLLVLIAQSLFRKRISPQWSYALWLLVVVRLMLPISPESSWSLFNLTSGSREPVAAAQADRGFPASAPDESVPFASETSFIPLAPDERPSTSREATPVQPSRTSPQWGSWQTILMGVWLSGAFVLTLRMALINLRFARSLRCARPIEDTEIIDLFEQCRADAGLRRRPSLLETALVESPSLFGFIHPILLLPPGMATRFSPAQLRHIFLHELAHIRRGDVIIDWILACLQILHWFNPVIWLAFRRMRADRELACDALAMRLAGDKGSKSYGQTIIKVLETCHQPTTVPGLVGILENPNEMKQRLRTIATFGKSPRGYILALLLMATLAVVALTDATGDQDTSAEILDPTRPMPRELVLEALRMSLALPPEDKINWEEAVAAGRIQGNVQILQEFLVARSEQVEWEDIEPPPTMTLPDGEEWPAMPLELLGPNLGANVTREDLYNLIPEFAEAQRRVNEYQRREREEFMAPDPSLDGSAPLAGRLTAEHFSVSRAYDVRQPGTVERTHIRQSLDGSEFSVAVYVEPDPFLDGTHVRDALAVVRDDRGVVRIWLNEHGRRNLTVATEEAQDLMLALFVEGELVSIPSVRARLSGESLELPYSLSQQEAAEMIDRWKGKEAHREIRLSATGLVGVVLWEGMHGTHVYQGSLKAGEAEKVWIPSDRPVRIEYTAGENLQIQMPDSEEILTPPGIGSGHFFLPGEVDGH